MAVRIWCSKMSQLLIIFFTLTFIVPLLPFKGVYGLYFDDDGHLVDYKALLTGTTK